VVAELTTLENKRQIVFKSKENSGEQILLVINDMDGTICEHNKKYTQVN